MKYEGPGTIIDKPGRDYGPLEAEWPWAIVLHTTETSGLPGYNNMAYNPKVTIDPDRRLVYRHVDLELRDGALKGSRQVFEDTGVWVPMGQKAINIEIIGYSSARIADQHPARLAVRDFTDDHYEFIAQVVAWIKAAMNVGWDITPQPAGGWTYGIDSPHRGTPEAWQELDGLTAHGWVYGQQHWDTNGLDLVRIWNRVGEILMTAPNIDEASPWAKPAWEKAYEAGLITEATKPKDDLSIERFFVFLDRLGLLD